MRSAVIFDHDGVLADSEPLQKKSFDIVLARYGVRIPDDEFRSLVGRKAMDGFKFLIFKYNLPLSAEKFAEEKTAAYRAIMEKELHPLPGVLEILEYLDSRKIPMAVVSGSPRKDVMMALDHFGISACFRVIITGEDVKEGKPDPEGFLKAVKVLGSAPSSTYVVEDSGPGIMAASSAGLTGIAVPGHFTQDHDFTLAKRVFPSFPEVLKYFKEIFDNKA
jgi:beta-phosphoglucomutase